jgi:hypothetical protein
MATDSKHKITYVTELQLKQDNINPKASIYYIFIQNVMHKYMAQRT